jgi:F-type H+-transporting ATPase subunit b
MQFIDIAHAAPEETTETAEHALTAETTTGSGPLAPLGITLNRFVPQLINFVIVLAVVWFLILKPLTKKMNERQKMIDESLSNAEKIQEKLTKGERDYQARIDEAKVEANKIMEKASAAATELGESMKEKAKKDIEMLVDQAKRNIEIERDETIRQVKNSTATLVVAAVEKILSEKMDGAKDQKLVEEMVSKIAYAEEK